MSAKLAPVRTSPAPVWQHRAIDVADVPKTARLTGGGIRRRLIGLLALGLDDSTRARSLVAATLYAVFVPLAVAVEVSGGATRVHPAGFWAITGFLTAQLVLALAVEITDAVAVFFAVAVPVSYTAYAAVAFGPTDSLWPCLVLPVVWCSLFLPLRLVGLSVALNAVAGASGFLWPSGAHPSAVVVTVRAGTLVVAAVIIAGLVSQIRASRDRFQAAADTLQGTLVPERIPQLPGLAVAAAYRPLAARGIQVGGDFYDVFPCPGGSHAVCVGDVEGKGLEAAALTGLIRHEVRSQLYLGATAAEVLARVNATLDARGITRSCALVVALLRPAPGGWDVRFARAGHPAPVRVGKAAAHELEGGLGPLLGISGNAEYAEARTHLRAGERLVLYTDGVTEARRDHEQFGAERLTAALAAPGGSADDDCARVLEAVGRFAPAASDDLTVVAVAVR